MWQRGGVAKGCVCVAKLDVCGKGGLHGRGGICGKVGMHGKLGACVAKARGIHGKEGACVVKRGHTW